MTAAIYYDVIRDFIALLEPADFSMTTFVNVLLTGLILESQGGVKSKIRFMLIFQICLLS